MKMDTHSHRTPVTFVAEHLTDSSFCHNGDVEIDGNVSVKGGLIVGGNLSVSGNLSAGDIYCFGKIQVGGSVKAKSLTSVIGIDVAGSVTCKNEIEGSIEPVSLHASLSKECTPLGENDVIVHRRIAKALLKAPQNPRALGPLLGADIKVGGDLTCRNAGCCGSIHVGGMLKVFVKLFGFEVEAQDIWVGSEIDVRGAIISRGGICTESITAEGMIVCAEDLATTVNCESLMSITAGRNIIAGNIRSKGEIEAGGCLTAYKAFHYTQLI